MESSLVLSAWIVLGFLMAMGTLICVPQAQAARAFFVFGDSLVDNGNNNYLATEARADSPPYGIDYPTHRPTGRFSNGLNIPDYLSMVVYLFSIYYQHYLLWDSFIQIVDLI